MNDFWLTYLIYSVLFLVGYFLGKYIQHGKDDSIMKRNTMTAYMNGLSDGKLEKDLSEAGYITTTETNH